MICSVVLLAHLDRVLDRPLRLAFERRSSPVPEHRLAVGRVDDRRSAAAAGLAGDSDRDGHAVRPAPGRVMASRTAHRGVERNPRIEIELAAQLILSLGDRIGRRNVDLGRERLAGRAGTLTDSGSSLINSGFDGSPEVGKRASGPSLDSPPFTSSLTVSVNCLVSIGRAGAVTAGSPFCVCASRAGRPWSSPGPGGCWRRDGCGAPPVCPSSPFWQPANSAQEQSRRGDPSPTIESSSSSPPSARTWKRQQTQFLLFDARSQSLHLTVFAGKRQPSDASRARAADRGVDLCPAETPRRHGLFLLRDQAFGVPLRLLDQCVPVLLDVLGRTALQRNVVRNVDRVDHVDRVPRANLAQCLQPMHRSRSMSQKVCSDACSSPGTL